MDTSRNYLDHQKYNEIEYYIEISRFAQAQQAITDLLGRYPTDGRLLYLMGFCCYRLGELDDAAEFTQQALRQGFSKEAVHSLLGSIQTESNEFVDAEKNFLEALRINPQNASILAAYSHLMLKTGHTQKANVLLHEALRLDPQDTGVMAHAFYHYLAQGKKEALFRTIERYVKSASEEVQKLIFLGLTELFQRHYKSAREHFRAAFLLDPNDKELLKILETLDRQTHILYFPQRVMEKLGGPAGMWLIFISLVMGLMYFKLYMMATIIGIVYCIFAVYTWITPLLYKISVKMRD